MLKIQKDLFWHMAYLLGVLKPKMTNDSSLLGGVDQYLIILYSIRFGH